MKIQLKNQTGSLIGPLHTTDAFDDAEERILLGFKNDIGPLTDEDLAAIQAILDKYSPGSVVTAGGGATTTHTGNARDAGREAGARVRANIEHNQTVAASYRDFWNAHHAAELLAATRR